MRHNYVGAYAYTHVCPSSPKTRVCIQSQTKGKSDKLQTAPHYKSNHKPAPSSFKHPSN